MYTENSKKIRDNNILNKEDIFDFEFSPHKDRFNDVYLKIHNIFTYEARNYNIENPIILFENNFSVNARARYSKGYNVILINSGTIVWLVENIIENEKLIKFNKLYNQAFSKIQFFNFQELIFQINILFTFHHEFAHLIQNSNQSFNWMNEQVIDSNYSIQKHSLEIDADTYSAIQIARHLIQYYEKDFKNYGINFLEFITIVLGANLFFYISAFGNSNKKLHYYENSHPHPFIRVMRVIFTVGKYYEDDKEINLTKTNIVEKMIDEIFVLQNAYTTNNLPLFKEEISNNYLDIFNYLQEISDYETTKINSAVEIYNRVMAD